MKTKFVSFLLITCLGCSAYGKELWAKSYLGRPAPPLVVQKWLTPRPNMTGKFVLLDFWATWCRPCRKAIPELNKIQRRFGDKICVIGLSDEPEATVRAMLEPKIEYAIAIDTSAKLKNYVEVTGIPHVMLMDPNGIVRWEGYPLLEGEELTPEIVGEIISKYSQR